MDLDILARKAISLAEGVEYSTFSTSVDITDELLKEEENGFKSAGVFGKVAVKTRINREFRELIEKQSGKKQDKDGDVNFMLHVAGPTVSVTINPLFLLCKYNKLSRELSQTRWDKYKSVEGYVVDAAMEMFGCSNAFLHGAGREDVDVRMLGDGRLCVVEIVEPKNRNVDLREYERRVNEISNGAVELHVIRPVGREYVWIVKEAGFVKEYEAKVEFEREVSDEELKRICHIDRIEQQTPLRVKHRRADLERIRRIYEIECIERQANTARFKIKTEAGTYIKELVTSDGGRTRPSFAGTVGCNAKCVSLDVIKVYEYISEWW